LTARALVPAGTAPPIRSLAGDPGPQRRNRVALPRRRRALLPERPEQGGQHEADLLVQVHALVEDLLPTLGDDLRDLEALQVHGRALEGGEVLAIVAAHAEAELLQHLAARERGARLERGGGVLAGHDRG